jgi:hypothetical protein
VFEIGTKLSESDDDDWGRRMNFYDTQCVLYTDIEYVDYSPLILDGDLSTGIDHDFGPGHDTLYLELTFPYPYYVSKITVKNSFGGGATNYSLYVTLGGGFFPIFAQDIATEKTFQINNKINGIWFELDNDGTSHFYCNDVIIEFTPAPSDIDEVINDLNNLTNSCNTYKEMINDLNAEVARLNNDIANLTAELASIEPTDQEKVIEKDSDNFMIYIATIIGIIGIILAVVALLLILLRSKQRSSIN